MIHLISAHKDTKKTSSDNLRKLAGFFQYQSPDIFLLVVHVVYQVLLVTDLEIDPFAIAGKIEYVFVFCLGVLEVSGFLLADTSAIGSDEVTVYVIGYRQKLGTSDIYDLLADHKMYSKGIVLN